MSQDSTHQRLHVDSLSQRWEVGWGRSVAREAMAPRRWLCAAAAAAVAPTATTIAAELRWTICRSNHTEGHIPPSQWSEATRLQHCFLHRDDLAGAPGTALFQHWLSDFDEGGWDPRNDFSSGTL